MSTLNSLAVEENIFSRLQVKETFLLLALSVAVPFAVHLLPDVNGVPIGAILLAMFFAPLIAVRFFKFHVGLVIAFLSPLINFAIAGNPKAVLLPVITLQLLVFVLSLKLLNIIKSVQPAAAVISYLFCIMFSSVVLLSFRAILPGTKPELFLLTSMLNALPGIILLALSDFAIRKLKKG